MCLIVSLISMAFFFGKVNGEHVYLKITAIITLWTFFILIFSEEGKKGLVFCLLMSVYLGLFALIAYPLYLLTLIYKRFFSKI